MHAALRIHDAMLRSLMHSSRSHVMRGVTRSLDPRRGVVQEFRLLQIEGAEPQAFEFTCKRLHKFQ